MIWNKLKSPFLILAPMEGVTDVMFRSVVAHAGRPDLFFTEFTNVSSYASEKGRWNALERLEIAPTDPPIIAQIWGKNPEHFAATASAIESLGFAGLDLNFGCPDKNVNKTGGGAAMIKTPDLAVECFRNARAHTNLPVSIKTRLGWSEVSEFRTWLPILLREHPAALTVHLRTKKEMSKVPAHYELIPEICELRSKCSSNTKLIINGDIKNKTEAETLKAKYPEVDGFMIGRGVFQNPYCFTDHIGSKDELMGLLRLHLKLYQERLAVLAERSPAHQHLPYEPLKHFFKIYVNNFPGASILRAELMETHSVEEAYKVLERYEAGAYELPENPDITEAAPPISESTSQEAAPPVSADSEATHA
ncbi:tRNA-dihydrouridine synthase family protein [Candidatus Saccharibacteria bacterium]|nr:tRNA-dihydrouridine synthase family protein [Candidatus Saccharibacteria bacterium]